jgi:molecular chaperone GrpE
VKRADKPKSEETDVDAGRDPGATGEVAEDQPDGAVGDERSEPAGEPVAERTGEAPEEEVAALRERYLRLAAEFDNFRKRTERERLEARDRAQSELVERLLEPIDDLQRVAHYSAEGTTTEALLEGVRMVERKLLRLLEAAGLEPLDAHGERFDPSLHEALMMAPTEVAEEDDTVGEVFQPGYRFRGMLLRPARVQVRRHGG